MARKSKKQVVAAEQPSETPVVPVVVEQVVAVDVARGDKIAGINKANYAGNLQRAKDLKAMLRESLQNGGGFPSHRFVQKNWGFNISLKAIIRHKAKVAAEAGLEKVATTDSLPRTKKAKIETTVEA